MFKQYPYKGWLILAILLWGAVAVRYYQRNATVSPQNMARSIERDLHDKERAFNLVSENGELIGRIFNNRLSVDDVKNLTELSIGIYAYRNDALVFWNNNKVLADCTPPQPNGSERLYQNERGKFVKTCITPDVKKPDERIVALFPIVTTYPFDNKYLQSAFDAQDYIPASSTILSRPKKGSYPIATEDGKTIFHVHFAPESLPDWSPGSMIFALIILAILFYSFLATVDNYLPGTYTLLLVWLFHTGRSHSYFQGFDLPPGPTV